jgi:glucosamine--fructose-6-phosphate aminotransferase (isomerizing)
LCGIIGYTGYRHASLVVLDALKRLEYRGYDSVGVAVSNQEGLDIRKDTGRVEEVDVKHNFNSIDGTKGIGHTRWATHGGVTQVNAHPPTIQ